jgi:hypothetical protein
MKTHWGSPDELITSSAIASKVLAQCIAFILYFKIFKRAPCVKMSLESFMSGSPPPPRSPHSQVVHSSHSPCAHFPASSFHCGSSYSIQFPPLIFRICLCKSARQSDSEDICFLLILLFLLFSR